MLSKDEAVINGYNGKYLEKYAWAAERKKQLDSIKKI